METVSINNCSIGVFIGCRYVGGTFVKLYFVRWCAFLIYKEEATQHWIVYCRLKYEISKYSV